MSKQPEKIISFDVYSGSQLFMGIADVELPNIEFMSETLSGAGIAGELDSPTIGHTSNMNVKIKFRTATKHALGLSAPKRHELTFRASTQARAIANGAALTTFPQKIMVAGTPKSASLGKFESGKQQDVPVELSCDYLKSWIDNEPVVEIDKFNMIHKVGDTDYLQQVRSDLGREG